MEGGDSRSLTEPPFIARVSVSIKRKLQYLLDKSTIYVYGRWGVTLALLALYLVRVFYLNAFHIVTYGLGIYLLNLFIGFLSPQVDTENDGPLLPHKQSEEFRPFTRRVPEFQFCARLYTCGSTITSHGIMASRFTRARRTPNRLPRSYNGRRHQSPTEAPNLDQV
ncbi:unnamed protein product [Peronospora belbahrii]|uniref:Protein RER1 n=1 Tax=Peronospora belbahrii TaxID=622444 RepID=A0ABN8D4L1_9STRA|nr:unnamed protein product [Peronospora belbahrii]